MKIKLTLALVALLALAAQAQQIVFTNPPAVSFTTLDGKVFKDVQIVRAGNYSLLWQSGTNYGQLYYTNLDSDLAASWSIPRVRIDTAKIEARARPPRLEGVTPKALTAGDQVRTWTFVQDGEIKTEAGSTGFRKGGRVDAEFIKLVTMDGTNAVFLKLAGSKGWLPLACLSEADTNYLAGFQGEPEQVTRQREANLAARAKVEAQFRRQQADYIARNQAAEKAAGERVQGEKKQRAEQEREARLAPYKPLWEGQPVDASLHGNWSWARGLIQRVADTGNLVHAQLAKDILSLADDITVERRENRQSAVEMQAHQMKKRLEQLLDAGVLGK
jgi:hypothetical protein